MAWSCEVRRLVNYNIVRHKPLAGSTTFTTSEIDPFGSTAQEVGEDISDPAAGWSASVPDIVQSTCSPSMVLRLTGYAVRVAFRANAPKALTYGGVTLSLLREDVRETTLARQDGVVFFRTDWVLDYLVPSAPGELPMPANPFIGTDGGV